MVPPVPYQSLADLVLVIHLLFVGFVVIGLPVIVIGGLRKWDWVRRPVWRLVHLAGIGVVVAQAWLGIICPLTTLEMFLRGKAGGSTYGGTFIQHWLQKLLYLHLPLWVFTAAYTAFAAAVAWSWWKVRPRFHGWDDHP